jgi:hypothetical protein
MPYYPNYFTQSEIILFLKHDHNQQHHNVVVVVVVVVDVVVLGITFMQGIHPHTPEKNHVPMEHCVTTILM